MPYTRKPTPSVLAATLVAVLFCLLAGGSTAAASTGQFSVIEDPRRTLNPDPAVRTPAFAESAELGADMVKLNVGWRSFAPDPESVVRPALDLNNPDAYPLGTWSTLDAAVAEARAHGLSVWLSIAGPAPRWAVPKESGRYEGNVTPDPALYGQFAHAVGKRYPTISIFSFWNEPNLERFLAPQKRGSMITAAVHYRKLYLAGSGAVRASGHAKTRLLFGELMPRAAVPKSLAASTPIGFLRDFFCINSKGKALRGTPAKRRECSSFKKLRANGLAHHPYGLSSGPLTRDRSSNQNATINYMPRLARVLDQAYKAKRLANRGLRIYNSEFGFQSNPPDRSAGVPISRIPTYLNYAEYLGWVDRRVASYSQYQILDDVELAAFQTGLRFADGKLKPRIPAAYATPIVVMRTKSRNRVTIWGGLRKKATKNRRIALQLRVNGRWRTAKRVTLKAGHRYFRTTVARRGARSQLWRISSADGGSRSARAVAPIKPRLK